MAPLDDLHPIGREFLSLLHHGDAITRLRDEAGVADPVAQEQIVRIAAALTEEPGAAAAFIGILVGIRLAKKGLV